MAVFTAYSGSDLSSLTSALLAPSSGIVISSGSIALNESGQNAVNFYDGSLAPLGIGSGLLITSGTTPGLVNTVGWFGTDNSVWPTTFYNGDPDIDAVVNTVFQTQSYDATTLQFDFTVTDPTATSVSFDLVFGTDEYPEWVDQFVDCGIVMVNGVNYALFNHDPLHPLSVVSSNLAAGYFQDNAANAFPIEYDGVSHVLKIVAPIIPGGATNHIKIGIADTGDHIYDSGLFLANFSAGNIPGSGVVIDPNAGTDNSDNLTGSSKDEYFDLKGGDDTCYAGAGDDIVVAGSGNDKVYGGSGADQLKGDAGDDSLDGGADLDTAVYSKASGNYIIASAGGGFTVTDTDVGPASEGADALTSIEYLKFSDGLFALGPGGVLTPVTDPGTPPANTPGSVAISGIASLGKTLTATVSDPNGISGSVSYQWKVSGDNGASWTPVGADSDTYTITGADVGKDIQVVASYTDNGANPEAPVSAAKAILSADGDLVVTLLQMTAPLGASIMNPLTTLVQDAIDLGVSPNVATVSVKAVLGLPDEINLLTYDSYAALQLDPNDPTALQHQMKATQVAVLTSLSGDDTGVNLTLAILNAAAAGQTLDLADIDDLSGILGIPAVVDPDTGKYAEPLNEIFDRNKSMSDAIADGGDVSVIEAEWQDLLSIQDNIDSTSIADLNIHVNQAPTGTATASLVDGLEDTDYVISASDLLQGFSDSEGDTLSVSGLNADNGSVVDSPDGTFTIIPALNFTGPVELTYTVEDGQGGSAPASQLFVIAPANDAPTVTSASTADANENLPAGTVVYAAAASDPDTGDTTSWSLTGTDAALLSIDPDGHVTLNDPANFEANPSFSFNVVATDSGGLSGEQAVTLAINNLDEIAPTITSAATATAIDENSGAGQVVYTVTADDDADISAGVSFGLKPVDDFAAFSIDGGTGAVTLTGNPDFEDKPVYSFTVLADDGVNPASERAVTLAIDNLDEVAPTITSAATATAIDENSGAGQVVYTVTADDDTDISAGVSFSLKPVDDFAAFSIDGGTGAVTLTGNPDSEDKPVYSLTVLADDGVNPASERAVTLAINNLDEVAPTITSAATATAIDENSGAGQVVYTVTADDDADISAGVSFSLKPVDDFAAFSIDGGTGAVTLTGNPDFEDKSAYSFTVLADDGVNPASEQAVTLAINNLSGVTIVGTSGADTIDATAEDDNLDGGAGKDTISALGGNDSIDGGAGADKMSGGTGDDLYVVDSKNDLVIENLNEGADTVSSSITYKLGANLENLSLTGASNVNATGNALDNQINGNSGNNVLAGLDGADTLTGGDGVDRFVFTAVTDSTLDASDVITDFVSGIDLIDVSAIDANNATKKPDAFLFGGYSEEVLSHRVTWFEREGDTFVQADVDGNTTADFQIVLAGTGLNLHATDFLL